jgi:orotidine-5'-phosphate decarboxylase
VESQRAARPRRRRDLPEEIARVRAIAPTLPLLIPGVGAQGGDARRRCAPAGASRTGRPVGAIIVSSSRGILYASDGDDFAAAARQKALQLRQELALARI